jgi:DNA-binding HxlR family transcriptional regulator
MDPNRIYRHFCMMARALEVVGERWSLLIVRDLLLGPLRFSDLARNLNEITPTRLTSRLRRLEAAGIVAREAPKRGREVWYRLTDAGVDLEPVVDALTLWGIEHAREGPQPMQAVHAEPVMVGTKVWLNAHGAAPPDQTAWVWRFPGEDYFTLRFAEGVWALSRGKAEPAAVTVLATEEAWASFLTAPLQGRRLPQTDVQLEAAPKDAKRFAKAFRSELGSA